VGRALVEGVGGVGDSGFEILLDPRDLGGVGGLGEGGGALGPEVLEADFEGAGGVHGGGLHHDNAEGEQAHDAKGEDVGVAEAIDGVFHAIDGYRTQRPLCSTFGGVPPVTEVTRPRLLAYLNLTVASAIAASMAVISQNLTTTFGSAQPFIWKWWWMGARRKTRRPSPYLRLVYLK